MARTVIVMGMEMPLPIVETTPSVVHMEMYKTANTELDQLAYDLTRRLNRSGYASFFFPRDGFGGMRALRENNRAAFSHVMAAKYAGLGTIGASHCLLTPEFGPRVRFVSVLTSAEISPDAALAKELCIKCEACAKCCPKKAIRMRTDRIIGDYDDQACLGMAEELVARRCFPCGICTKVCPIGKDRSRYGQKGAMKKYLREGEALAANPDDPEYKSWTHLRKYGVARGRKQDTEKGELPQKPNPARNGENSTVPSCCRGNPVKPAAGGHAGPPLQTPVGNWLCGAMEKNTMQLGEFCERFQTLLGQRPKTPFLLDAGQRLLRELLKDPGWFAEFLQKFIADPAFLTDQPTSVFDNEIRLHRSPDRSFTILAYLWDDRNLCLVHDHNAWGIIGALLHPLREVKYRQLDDGQAEGVADLEQVSDLVFQAGEVGIVLPLNKGIHQTGAALDRPAISLGVYGRSIRQGSIHFFDPAEKKVSRAQPRTLFRKVLALRALASLGEMLGQTLLTPPLLESLPDDLVREFREYSAR